MSSELSGVIPPMVTPLRDGRIDTAATRALVDRLIIAGVSGIFVMGSSGEGASLTAAARRELVACAVDAANGRVPVLAGVIETSTPRTIEAAQLAVDAGAQFVVLMPPLYFVPDFHSSTIRHVELAAAALDVPVIIYNNPSLTHNPITAPTLTALAEIPGVVAFKDSSADWDLFIDLLAAGHDGGLRVFQGAERLIGRSIAAGADGAVPGIANVDPELSVALVLSASAGDAEKTAELDARMDRLCRLYDHGYWLSALKQAVAQRGWCGSEVSEPLPPVDPIGRAEIAGLLAAEGIATRVRA